MQKKTGGLVLLLKTGASCQLSVHKWASVAEESFCCTKNLVWERASEEAFCWRLW